MRKAIVVAVREYQAAVRTKAFIITLVAMPVLMGGSIAAQLYLKDKVDINDRKLAVIDGTGVLFDELAAAVRERNETDIFEDRPDGPKQVRPRFLLERFDPPTDTMEETEFELSQRVREKELFAFAIIPKDAIFAEEGETGAQVTYYSNTPTYGDLRRWLSKTLNRQIQLRRLDRAGLDPAVVAAATKPIWVDERGLASRDKSGRISLAERANEKLNIAIAVGMMMLMLMVVMVGASPLVNIVLEEKMHRIAEVLLGSVPPFQLMLGKLIGTVGVSLTLATFYFVGAFVALNYAGYGALFPKELVWWFVVYQVLAVMMYGSLFIAVGAACSDLKEAQSMLMPVTILIVSPFFVWMNVLKAPSATFAVAVSLFPPATPMLMLLRQSIPPSVPLWQPALGITLVALTTAFFVFTAGRIFRVGILMQGRGAKFGEMLRWAFRG